MVTKRFKTCNWRRSQLTQGTFEDKTAVFNSYKFKSLVARWDRHQYLEEVLSLETRIYVTVTILSLKTKLGERDTITELYSRAPCGKWISCERAFINAMALLNTLRIPKLHVQNDQELEIIIEK